MLRKIALRSSEDGFPKYTDFGVDKESVEDYLSEKQDVLNLRGSQTRQFTVVGCLILIPALIASGFDHTQSPFGDKTSLVAMLGGVEGVETVDKHRYALSRHTATLNRTDGGGQFVFDFIVCRGS